MSVILSDNALTTVEVAKRYLRDGGYPVDDGDMLKLHINAVSGFIARFTGRKRLAYSSTALVEYRDGMGQQFIYTREAPIRQLVSVSTYPFEDNYGETMTGPTPPALHTDDLWIEPANGRIFFKNGVLPSGAGVVALTYTAGFYDDEDGGAGVAADVEFSALRLIALEALLRKWQRWTEKRVGVESRSSDAGSVSYTNEDFDRAVLDELKRYRRQWVA